MTYTAKLNGAIFGHKRGKRDNGAMPVNVGEQAFRCPRCSATWARKAKPVKLKAVA